MKPSSSRPRGQATRRISRREALIDGTVLTMLAVSGGSLAWQMRDRIPGPDGQFARATPAAEGDFRRVTWDGDAAAEAAYAAFLATLSLHYIAPEDVVAAHRNVRNGVPNQIPPTDLWENMRKPLQIADELRKRLGSPLRNVASAYRCPEYNKQLPGAATGSLHMENKALDLMFECSPASAFDAARKLRDEGFFMGGIGRYPSFIHIDARGENVTW